MKVSLVFSSHSEPSVTLQADTDAEKAILAFLAEGGTRRWKATPSYSYRAGGLNTLALEVDIVKDDSRDRD